MSNDTKIRLVHIPLGGELIWLKFPNGVGARDMIDLCVGAAALYLAYGVQFNPSKA